MNKNKVMKRFLAIAACITTVGCCTDTSSLAATVTVDERANATGTTGIISNKENIIFKDYTWKSGAENSANVDVVSGGTLNVSNYSSTVQNGTINATGGNINLTSGTLTVGTGSSITGAVVNQQSSSSTILVDGGSAYLSNADTLNGNIDVNSGTLGLDQGTLAGDLTVNGGGAVSDGSTIRGDIDISDGTTIFTDTTLNGAFSLSGGSTSLENSTKNNSFIQTGGITTITGTTFNFNNSDDSVLSGGLFIGDGTTTTVGVSQGTIAQGTNVDLAQNSTTNISGGNVTLGSDDNWNGNVNLTGGSLALVGISKNPSATYTQSGGALTVTGDTLALNNTADTISGGSVTIGSGTESGYLTVDKGSINSGTTVHVTENSALEVAGGNVTLDQNNTKWDGEIGITKGHLTLNNVSKNNSGIFTQYDGTTTITGSRFTLNNDLDSIEGGVLNIGTETQSGSFDVNDSRISQNTIINIASSGELIIDKGETNYDRDDTWAGTIDLHGDGVLNIDNTQKTGTLIQTDGTVNLTGKKFDLNSTDDLIDGGTFNIGNGTTTSKLTVSKGEITKDSTLNINKKSNIDITGGKVAIDGDDTWDGNINMTGGSLNISGVSNKTGILTQSGGATTVTGKNFDLNNENDYLSGGSLTIGNGTTVSNMSVSQGAISKDTSVTISKNSTLNANGGIVSLGSNTSWTGNVNVTGGKLTLDSTEKNFDGVFNQSDGTTIVTGTGFDLDNSADIISGGILHVGDKTTVSNMSVSQGYIDTNAVVNVNRNGTLNVSGGDVVLDNRDAWQGTVNVSDGSLALVGIDKSAEAKYTQTGGTTTVTGSTLVLNNTGDKVSGGILNIGNGGTESALKVSQGAIDKDATLNITSNSKLNISGGKVTVDNGDTWSGDVNLSGGELLIDDFSNKNGTLTQTNGAITVTGSGFDLNQANDKLSGGTLNVGNGTTKSDMKISQGLVDYNTRVNIMTNAELNVTGGTVNLSNAFKADGGVLSQSAGTTTVTGNNLQLNNANDEIAGGTFNIGNGSTVTELGMSQGTIHSEAITNVNANAKLNINGGNVNLDSSDTWRGDINISSGSLALVGVTKNQSGMLNQTGGVTTVTGDTFNLNNSADKISGGTFNIGTSGENSIVTVSKGTIAEGASTNIALDSTLNIGGGNVTLDGATDNFDGNVNLTSGNLTLNGMNKNTSGVLTQTNGTTTVIGQGSKLNNENDQIASGKLNIGSNSTAGTLEVERGTILSNASVSIKNGSTLNINGGQATIDGSNDNWSGELKVSNGNLNLTGVNKTTTSEAKFNQTGGTTNINDNSKITLNTADSKITGGVINIAQTGELDVNNSSANESEVNSTGGKFSLQKGSKYSVTGGVIDSTSKVSIEEGAAIEVNGKEANVTLDGNNDKFAGSAFVTNGTLALANGISKTTTSSGTFNQTGGMTNISGTSSLVLNDVDSVISDGEVNVTEGSTLTVNNGKEHSSKLNVASSHFGLKGNSTYTTKGGTIDSESKVEIDASSTLRVDGEDASVTLGRDDKWTGNVKVDNGNLYISEDLTKVTDATGNYIQTGGNMTISGAKLALADQNSLISGGNVNLTNHSTLTVAQNSAAAITGGNVVIDDTSVLNYLAQKGLIQMSEGNKINIDTSGLINMANNVRSNSVINNLTINNGESGDGQADFAIDIYARNNGNTETDTIAANSIQVAAKDATGTIRISDYNLGGDLMGYDAPIDRHIRLGKIFKSDDIGKEVTFTATDKEIFTPIGYYRLNASSANDGNYSLDLARYNPQVFRGQVATAASYMNQLVVNDTLFNRAQIRRYGASYDQMFKNKTALIEMQTTYERTLKEGQLWTEVYGNFETLKMTHGLNKVRNNSWGFIIGGDFGLRELRNGWSYMPSAYIAYNGGRQTFNKVGMYENGAQIGYMGSWMKDKFQETVLGYVGAYGTNIDVAGESEDAFNYFVGVASKTAYDWQIRNHFKIQPSLTLAYNMFGQQNWHSDYGQMGMSSGFLNGFNVAPGVNFIYQQEDWSVYATIAYAWNFFGGMDGRAGNVDLPDLEMKHGYLQYGFGMTRSFSDRLNMYAQATVRNIGRTGIICQGGLNWRL